MESLLREYPISSAEGLALMRLAEALLRVPDTETAIALTADQLGKADFDAGSTGGGRTRCWPACRPAPSRCRRSSCPKPRPTAASSSGWARRPWSPPRCARCNCSGASSCSAATSTRRWPRPPASARRTPQLRFSYDMLGEGARTEADARRYLASYLDAHPGDRRRAAWPATRSAPTASRSSSARCSRATRTRSASACFAELLPRVWQLIEPAARANINLTIDAEESDRLELSLDVFDALAARIAAAVPAVARLRPGGAGLPDARARRGARGGAHRAQARPALHGAAGQGRVLGRRGQARAGTRASPATRCSRTSTTPTSPTWPARRR